MRVDRGKLYGRRERVILDENGERCVPAFLTPDGAALVPPGGTAHIYVDESFDTVDRGDLRAVDEEGNEVDLVASTLGVSQALEPVRPERLLDHVVTSVYELATAQQSLPSTSCASLRTKRGAEPRSTTCSSCPSHGIRTKGARWWWAGTQTLAVRDC